MRCSIPENKFQFYLSSIKSRGQPRHKKSDKSFNSTLVQLKVAISLARFTRSDKFQFYLSSIKSRINKYWSYIVRCVSILP